MHRLRREQPRLHRELCEIVFRLRRVRDALVALPEAYVLEGAMSEMLVLTDHAMQEVRDSLADTRRRRRQATPISRDADQVLIGAFCNPQCDAGPAKKIILLDDSQDVAELTDKP